MQSPDNALEFSELGINLFIGLWKGPTEAQLKELKLAQMRVIAAQNDVALGDQNNDIIVGWLMPDEPDNKQKIAGDNDYTSPTAPETLIKRYLSLKAKDPTRPIMVNFGQGVASDGWHGRGTRTNHPEDYEQYVKAGDIVSFDIYPVTHKNPMVRGRLDLVAKGVDRLIRWTDGEKPVWSFVGASRVSNPDVLPTGDDIRRQVWLSIIHGATGIVYYVHQFLPKFVEAGLLQHEELSGAVKDINARITSIARVLNSETIERAVTVDGTNKGSAVTALVKQDRCYLYIFAGSKSGLESNVTFHVKQRVRDQNFAVLDESRSVYLKNGSFDDYFGPYAVHLYQLKRDVQSCL